MLTSTLTAALALEKLHDGVTLDHTSGHPLGHLRVKLATTAEEILAAQRLRYRVFFDEMGATPDPDAPKGVDVDAFDAQCDHLIVQDMSQHGEVVGTYRLMRQPGAEALGRFYTQSEFNIDGLLKHGGQVLELGRSCVAPAHRTRPTLKLLWRGLGLYIDAHSIDLMFGCASFHGSDLGQHAEALAYLYHYHLAPEYLRPWAVESGFASMNCLPKDDLKPRKIMADLPALIKAYLKIGGFVGNGAFVDVDFNTIDICIIVQTSGITEKYVRLYF